jgi:hypothetical protein
VKARTGDVVNSGNELKVIRAYASEWNTELMVELSKEKFENTG